MKSKPAPEEILQQIAAIHSMEKGNLSILRQTPRGPACNFQRWEDGRNRSEYIRPEQVPLVEENLRTFERFQTLMDLYVQTICAHTRKERLAVIKTKRPPRKSSLPGKPKSKG
jgi:hypothetical protein